MKKLVLIVALAFFGYYAHSQGHCKDSVTYKTINLGNGEEQLAIPLMFFFRGDSMWIANSEKDLQSRRNVPFKIVRKKCVWDAQGLYGESIYDLELTDGNGTRQATLSVKITTDKGRIILQYPDAEQRVFEMGH